MQTRKEESGIGDVTSGGLDVDTPVDEVKVIRGLRLVRSCRQPVVKKCDKYSPLVTLATADDSDASKKRIPPEERSGGQVAPSILVSPPGGGSDRSPLTDIPVSGQNRVRIIYRNGPTKSARRPQPKAQTTSATSGSASWHTTKTSAHAHPEQLIVERTASGLRTAVARRARRHGRGACATECIGATRGLGSWRKTICT